MGKKLLKEPDEFITFSEKAFKWAEAHVKFLIIMAGSVILEVMFSLPGIGRLFYDSIFARDYPVVMALSFITAAVVLLGILLSDLAYALVDPRITYD